METRALEWNCLGEFSMATVERLKREGKALQWQCV